MISSGVVNAVQPNEEDLERTRPKECQRRKEEACVIGGGDPAPAVVTFTTEMASVAVDELIAVLTSFHGMKGVIPNRVRRWHARDKRFIAPWHRDSCPACNSVWACGAGDVTPFLDMVD